MSFANPKGLNSSPEIKRKTSAWGKSALQAEVEKKNHFCKLYCPFFIMEKYFQTLRKSIKKKNNKVQACLVSG